jgi:hypothetical protein
VHLLLIEPDPPKATRLPRGWVAVANLVGVAVGVAVTIPPLLALV